VGGLQAASRPETLRRAFYASLGLMWLRWFDGGLQLYRAVAPANHACHYIPPLG